MAKSDPRGTLTPEIADRIVELVRDGNYFQVAAEAVGIHRSTLNRWIARGEEAGEGPYFEFAERLRRADAEAEVAAVAVVREGGKAWIANMTYLERRHPDRWRRASDTRPLKSDEERSPDEQFRARAATARAAASDGSSPLRVVADAGA